MLKVQNLCKTYPNFKLDNVTFQLEKGYIMGFLGKNGAGKTTTLKSILNLVNPDSGNIYIFNKNIKEYELEIKNNIGFMFGGFEYYRNCKIRNVTKVLTKFYKDWDNKKYFEYIGLFEINENKKVRELSAGMKVKLSITYALSHNAKLIIFDEPTSGLDPIARDELLDIFRDIVSDGEHSILFSTHITSDLDKCADYITLIKSGKTLFTDTKDSIIDSHYLIKGNKESLTEELKKKMIGYKINSYGFSGLIKKDLYTSVEKKDIILEKTTLDDIMIYYNRGDN